MTQVVIYNLGGHEVLGRVSLKHAITMLYRQVARVYEEIPGQRFGPHPRPAAVELVQYIYARWKYQRTGRMHVTKEGVLRRDRHKCGYCGRAARTIDHVVPRCQRGTTEWVNVVAACQKCNHRKGGHTPGQAGMRLRIAAYVPTLGDLYPARGSR